MAYYHEVMMDAFVRFRRDLCQVLADNGVPSNPGWTEDDIVRAFRQLLLIKSKRTEGTGPY